MTRERLMAIWLVAALALGIVLISGYRGPRPEAEAGRGKPRDVPMELLRRRIVERHLSDKEALYYEQVGEKKRVKGSRRP